MVIGNVQFVKCLLCGRQVKVALSKSNRPLYSCFTKDGGCGCQFYIREEPASQLFALRIKETMETIEPTISAVLPAPGEKAMYEEQITKPEEKKAAELTNEGSKGVSGFGSGHCPKCRKPVNWDSLPEREISEPELLDFIFEPEVVRIKECPRCGYAKKLKEA